MEAQWQPIETAPKNGGMDFLIYVPSEGIRLGFWRKFKERFGWYGSQSILREKRSQPTHWMPLPDTPVAEGASS